MVKEELGKGAAALFSNRGERKTPTQESQLVKDKSSEDKSSEVSQVNRSLSEGASLDVKSVDPLNVEGKRDEVSTSNDISYERKRVEVQHVNNKGDEDKLTEESPNFKVRLSKEEEKRLLRLIYTEVKEKKKERLGIFNPVLTGTMLFLKKTIPDFSASDIAGKYVMEGVLRDYPDIFEKVKKELEKSG
jgi:hypothetical protein